MPLHTIDVHCSIIHWRLEIAAELSLNVGSVEIIIPEHLKFCKVSARRVMKQLNSERQSR